MRELRKRHKKLQKRVSGSLGTDAFTDTFIVRDGKIIAQTFTVLAQSEPSPSERVASQWVRQQNDHLPQERFQLLNRCRQTILACYDRCHAACLRRHTVGFYMPFASRSHNTITNVNWFQCASASRAEAAIHRLRRTLVHRMNRGIVEQFILTVCTRDGWHNTASPGSPVSSSIRSGIPSTSTGSSINVAVERASLSRRLMISASPGYQAAKPAVRGGVSITLPSARAATVYPFVIAEVSVIASVSVNLSLSVIVAMRPIS
jgi:hypothetical protein